MQVLHRWTSRLDPSPSWNRVFGTSTKYYVFVKKIEREKHGTSNDAFILNFEI